MDQVGISSIGTPSTSEEMKVGDCDVVVIWHWQLKVPAVDSADSEVLYELFTTTTTQY